MRVRRDIRPSGAVTLHLADCAPVTLSGDDVARVAQLARMIEDTHFPAAWLCRDQIIGLRSIARELRAMVGLPAEDLLMPLEENDA